MVYRKGRYNQKFLQKLIFICLLQKTVTTISNHVLINYFFLLFVSQQGITVNCADNYSNKIDCQWIDITGIPFGNYSLRVLANPMRNVSESDWLNNRAVCEIEYHSRAKVAVRGCTTGTK